MSPQSPRGRRPAPRRPARGRTGRDAYKPPRDRAELWKAIAAGAGVVLLTAGAVVFLGRDEIWSDDPAETPAPTQLSLPTTTAPTATSLPAGTPPAPGQGGGLPPSTTPPATPAP
jgi:hypothetical protein